MIAGYAFGFRMTGGLGYAVAFLFIALLLCLAVTLGADALGSRAKSVQGRATSCLSPVAAVHAVHRPRPENTFPDWLRPCVRNQPVSQFAETLRGFATGKLVLANLAASLVWCAGMVLIFGSITLRMQRRG